MIDELLLGSDSERLEVELGKEDEEREISSEKMAQVMNKKHLWTGQVDGRKHLKGPLDFQRLELMTDQLNPEGRRQGYGLSQALLHYILMMLILGSLGLFVSFLGNHQDSPKHVASADPLSSVQRAEPRVPAKLQVQVDLGTQKVRPIPLPKKG